MKRNSSLSRTAYLARLSMLLAVVIVFTVFNIANIPVGPIVATIYQVPVIIGAVALGTKAGAILGASWGALCFWLAITGQTTDVVALGAISRSPFLYFVVAFLPRLLVGVLSGLIFAGLGKLIKKSYFVNSFITGALGSIVNTVGYLGLLYVIYKSLLATIYGIDASAVLGLVLSVASTNGLVEAAVSAIVVSAVCTALSALDRKKNEEK